MIRLQFPDATFDRVIAEAVTMFVDRPRAAGKLVRVCKLGGRVLTTEFLWRKPPTSEAHHVFMMEVCPGMMFDTPDEWRRHILLDFPGRGRTVGGALQYRNRANGDPV